MGIRKTAAIALAAAAVTLAPVTAYAGTARHINGTAGNDTLVGTRHDDAIRGFAGADSIRPKAGADYVLAGAGRDRVSATGDLTPDEVHGGAGRDHLDAGRYDYAYGERGNVAGAPHLV